VGESKKSTERLVGNKTATVFGLSELFHNPKELLAEIGLASSKVYRDIPCKCYACGYDKFSNLSLLGVYKEPVFYECEKCGALHLN